MGRPVSKIEMIIPIFEAFCDRRDRVEGRGPSLDPDCPRGAHLPIAWMAELLLLDAFEVLVSAWAVALSRNNIGKGLEIFLGHSKCSIKLVTVTIFSSTISYGVCVTNTQYVHSAWLLLQECLCDQILGKMQWVSPKWICLQ